MHTQASPQPNASPLSEAVRLKLMDAAMKFSYDCEDFLRNYIWLHDQAAGIKKQGAGVKTEQDHQHPVESGSSNQTANSDSSERLFVDPVQDIVPQQSAATARRSDHNPSPMPSLAESNSAPALQPEERPDDTGESDTQTSHT